MDGERAALPGAPEWRAFLDRLLLWSAAAALGVALVFFVAYNWQTLGRFGKFALAELVVLGAVLGYWKLGVDRTAAKAALLGGAIALGALLALFGQTYQTGADPWQLFATWAVLVLPWAVVGEFAALWVLVVALVNAAVLLYFDAFPGRGSVFLFARERQHWTAFLVNAAALALWELAALRFAWLAERWAPRLLAAVAGTAVTLLALRAVFDSGYDVRGAAALAFLAWSAALFVVYRRLRLDVFMLAGGCLSVIVMVASVLGRVIAEATRGADAFGFLFVALVVVGMAGASGWWLRQVARESGA